MTFQVKLDSAGRLVVPANFRKKYGLAGKVLILTETDQGLFLAPKKQKLIQAQNLFQKSIKGVHSSQDFISFKNQERKKETKKLTKNK